MATVTGLTAARMLEIEAASVVGGSVNGGGHLILTKHDASTIDAGSVIGPQGPQGPVGEVTTAAMNAALDLLIPIGSVMDYIGTVAPTNWLKMEGQTIVDGQTTYPTLWSKIPASMKSGSNIIMPDTRGKVSVGYNSTDADFDTIGETGGAKTVALTQAQLPAAGVTITPPVSTNSINPPLLGVDIDIPSFSATINPPATTISIDPPNTAILIDPPIVNTSDQSNTHDHYYIRRASYSVVSQGGASTTSVSSISDTGYTSGNASQGHVHSVDIPAFYAYVDIPAFNATCDIAPFSTTIDPPLVNVSIDIPAFNSDITITPFTSGNMGSGAAHNNIQPYVVLLKIIRAA